MRTISLTQGKHTLIDDEEYNRLRQYKWCFTNGYVANKKTIYKGACWNKSKKKWSSYIQVKGHLFYIGHFDKERWAAMAYDMAAKELHGEYASLNFN